MTLTIPLRGLDEIRRTWAGRGGLLGGVASAHDDDGVSWTPELARRRASRVVIEVVRPMLELWPPSRRAWIDALPAQSVRRRSTADVPGSGIDWVETRIAGWPPRTFHHRNRSRVADSVLVASTRWTIERVRDVVAHADRIDDELLGETARARVMVAVDMLDVDPLATAAPSLAGRNDLRALRSAGRPWGGVAAVAGSLLQLEHDPTTLAALALDPDPALADRIFHVAVLGSLLVDLRHNGWKVAVTGLPGSPDGRPQFSATSPHGETWDVWFEMAGAWSYYGVPAPYPPAAHGIAGTGGPLGSDIALVRAGARATVIECKYSANPSYVGRSGYEQTLAYMTEALTGLVTSVAGIVVGPPEVVTATGLTTTSAGVIAITEPDSLIDVVLEATGAGAALV